MIPADLSLSSLSVGHFPVVRAAMERLGMLEVRTYAVHRIVLDFGGSKMKQK